MENNRTKATREASLLATLLGNGFNNASDILDIGGVGDLPAEHFRKTTRYIGVSPLQQPGLIYVPAWTNLPIVPASYDAVVSSALLHCNTSIAEDHIRETAQFLAYDGLLALRCYLSTPHSRAAIAASKADPAFTREFLSCLLGPGDTPAGFPETAIHRHLIASGLSVLSTVYGNWCRLTRWDRLQDDVVFAVKRSV